MIRSSSTSNKLSAFPVHGAGGARVPVVGGPRGVRARRGRLRARQARAGLHAARARAPLARRRQRRRCRAHHTHHTHRRRGAGGGALTHRRGTPNGMGRSRAANTHR